MSTFKVEVKYDIGDVIFLKTDEFQAKYQVLGYYVRLNETLYEIYNHNTGEYIAHEFELSKEKEIQI